MNKFNTAAATLATLTNLVARAEALFGTSPVIGVHSYTHNCTVSVQLKEVDLLAWCAERNLAPHETKVVEQDYRPWGGGFTTFRQVEVVVEGTPELGRLVLTSSEVVSRRPAPSTEQGESVAVA